MIEDQTQWHVHGPELIWTETDAVTLESGSTAAKVLSVFAENVAEVVIREKVGASQRPWAAGVRGESELPVLLVLDPNPLEVTVEERDGTLKVRVAETNGAKVTRSSQPFLYARFDSEAAARWFADALSAWLDAGR